MSLFYRSQHMKKPTWHPKKLQFSILSAKSTTVQSVLQGQVWPKII
jgi:hypothetical protein